ncbi:hypothetical protein BDV93DRAFT_163170 [Ceratobasidium sp. AG-I]|nr:hypothetical protein BDV93DRAFT_163170 [Ceratobasidium sp. AG-I]
MFAKREALLARLPISPRTSISSTYSSSAERSHQPTNRSSSWSTCSEDSDMDASASTTPRRDALTPVPFPTDPLEAHRIHTPSGSVDFGSASKHLLNMNASPPQPPAARLVPTQAERIAALHAGLTSPPPVVRPISTSRRVSVHPAAVTHLQDANAALLARVEELEEATAKAQSEGAARMRRLQAEAETLRAQLGDAERANEGLRTEAEKEKEKLRVRTKSAGASAARHQKKKSADADELVPPVPRDFAPGATWRPEFRSLRGGVRPAAAEEASKAAPRTPIRSATGSTVASRAAATPVRAQSIATPSRSATQGSPLKHTPLKPSMLRHQRANSIAGLGKPTLSPVKSMSPPGTVFEEGEMKMETEEAKSPVEMKPSPTRTHPGILPFPSSDVPDEIDMSPLSTRILGESCFTSLFQSIQLTLFCLAQELVAKINELRSTNEEIQQQRDSLKDMLRVAEAEAEELKRVCERLENEVERTSEGTGSGGEGRASGGEGRKSGGEGRRSGGEGRRFGDEDLSLQLDAQSLGIRSLGLGDLGEEPSPEWTGSVRGRKGGGALQSLAAELGVMAELQGGFCILTG